MTFVLKTVARAAKELVTETRVSAPRGVNRGFMATSVIILAMYTVKLDHVTDSVVTVSGIVEMDILVINVPSYVYVLRMGILIKRPILVQVRNWQFPIL